MQQLRVGQPELGPESESPTMGTVPQLLEPAPTASKDVHGQVIGSEEEHMLKQDRLTHLCLCMHRPSMWQFSSISHPFLQCFLFWGVS